MRPVREFAPSILWLRPRRSTSPQALDSFEKLATRPTTAVFSTLLPSPGRALYQWNIQTLPCFLRSSLVNQPRCDISAFRPDSAEDCLGSNHAGSLPRGKPRGFFRLGKRGCQLAQAKAPHPSRAVADGMAGQLAGTGEFKDATPIEG